jgi:hypothetical protein
MTLYYSSLALVLVYNFVCRPTKRIYNRLLERIFLPKFETTTHIWADSTWFILRQILKMCSELHGRGSNTCERKKNLKKKFVGITKRKRQIG